MRDGVIYVYKDSASADKHQPLNHSGPDLVTFIDDMNFLITLIAQGPTYVHEVTADHSIFFIFHFMSLSKILEKKWNNYG